MLTPAAESHPQRKVSKKMSINSNAIPSDKFFHCQTSNNKNQYAWFSTGALEDKLVEIISSYNTADIDEDGIHLKWHYIDQAEALIYRINVYDPLPEFVIFTSDMPEWLLEALSGLGKAAMKRIITNAVRRIYESVDPVYFHTNGIYGKVRWRFAS